MKKLIHCALFKVLILNSVCVFADSDYQGRAYISKSISLVYEVEEMNLLERFWHALRIVIIPTYYVHRHAPLHAYESKVVCESDDLITHIEELRLHTRNIRRAYGGAAAIVYDKDLQTKEPLQAYYYPDVRDAIASALKYWCPSDFVGQWYIATTFPIFGFQSPVVRTFLLKDAGRNLPGWSRPYYR